MKQESHQLRQTQKCFQVGLLSASHLSDRGSSNPRQSNLHICNVSAPFLVVRVVAKSWQRDGLRATCRAMVRMVGGHSSLRAQRPEELRVLGLQAQGTGQGTVLLSIVFWCDHAAALSVSSEKKKKNHYFRVILLVCGCAADFWVVMP